MQDRLHQLPSKELVLLHLDYHLSTPGRGRLSSTIWHTDTNTYHRHWLLRATGPINGRHGRMSGFERRLITCCHQRAAGTASVDLPPPIRLKRIDCRVSLTYCSNQE